MAQIVDFDKFSATKSAGYSFVRSNPIPVDKTSYFGALSAATAYAASDPVAYVGQVLSVLEGNEVEIYKIMSGGTLEKVGSGAGSLSAATYSDALVLAASGKTSIGQLIYVTSSEEISGKTYNAGAYVIAGVGAAAQLQYLTSEAAGSSGLTGRVTALETSMGVAQTNITALQDSAHTHENKSVLDGITSEKVGQWDEAFASAHTHANKDVLDGIDAEDITAWNAAEENAKAYASAYTDGKLESYATSADTVAAIEAVENKFADYATSADTVSAIDAAKDSAIESAATFASAYTDEKLADYATSADTVSAIDSAKDSAIESAATFASAYTDEKISALSGSAKVELNTASSATSGYLKTYILKQGGNEIGKIDIPKDLVVSAGSIVKGTWVDDVFTEDPQGSDKALKLVIVGQETPIYINVKDLVDVYTAGSGITISDTNVVSAKVVEANGLSVDADGIKMGMASAEADGAMSKEDFAKLGGIESGAQVNVLEGVQLNGVDIDIVDKKSNINVNGANVKVTKDITGSTVVSGAAVDDVLQNIFDSLNGVKKEAVKEVETISGLTATITSGDTGAKLTINVKTETSTSATTAEGHLEIKVNDNGELYGVMYYLEGGE